jgi:hypothetical protein
MPLRAVRSSRRNSFLVFESHIVQRNKRNRVLVRPASRACSLQNAQRSKDSDPNIFIKCITSKTSNDGSSACDSFPDFTSHFVKEKRRKHNAHCSESRASGIKNAQRSKDTSQISGEIICLLISFQFSASKD